MTKLLSIGINWLGESLNDSFSYNDQCRRPNFSHRMARMSFHNEKFQSEIHNTKKNLRGSPIFIVYEIITQVNFICIKFVL